MSIDLNELGLIWKSLERGGLYRKEFPEKLKGSGERIYEQKTDWTLRGSFLKCFEVSVQHCPRLRQLFYRLDIRGTLGEDIYEFHRLYLFASAVMDLEISKDRFLISSKIRAALPRLGQLFFQQIMVEETLKMISHEFHRLYFLTLGVEDLKTLRNRFLEISNSITSEVRRYER